MRGIFGRVARPVQEYYQAVMAWRTASGFNTPNAVTPEALPHSQPRQQPISPTSQGQTAEEAGWKAAINTLERILAQTGKSAPNPSSAKTPLQNELQLLRNEVMRVARVLQVRSMRAKGIAIPLAVRCEQIIDDAGLAHAPQILAAINTLTRIPLAHYVRHPEERMRIRQVFKDLTGRRWLYSS
jgi:hypothetical protein